MKFKLFMAAGGLALASSIAISGAAHAAGGNVLVEDVGKTWGFNESANMTDVFGANFSEVSYAGLDATSLFSAGNSFVMLEGGNSSTQELADFLAANSSTVTDWVANGGHLLLQSASNQGVSISGIGPGALNAPPPFSGCGTLTAAGSAAFTFAVTPTNQCGGYLAHDTVSGSGLTDFMDGDGGNGPIIAGAALGSGYVMYSGLTTSNFHESGNGLTDDVIAYTAGAGGAVPEPAAWALMLSGFGLAGAALRRRALVAA